MDDNLGTLVDLTWKLLLVLALAVLAARALRWLSHPAGAPETLLRVVARLPIGPQQSLLLIAVGKKRLLVGQSAQQLTLLAELADEDLPVLADALPDPLLYRTTLIDRIRARLEIPRLQRVQETRSPTELPDRRTPVPCDRDSIPEALPRTAEEPR